MKTNKLLSFHQKLIPVDGGVRDSHIKESDPFREDSSDSKECNRMGFRRN
jgi:hypothetical protein